jgi:tetraacyldisaccharide 4'-kinase
LSDEGWKPGILTRGYGRTSPENKLVLAPAAAIPTERSGDEPQLFLRSGLAPVGIGADRFATGTLLARAFGLKVALLDDGFQHVRLARDIDVVLIDALYPFGGGRIFPLGRLREPLAALARAGIFLITRPDLTDLVPSIERQIRLWNREAPIFRARLEPQAWVETRTGARYSVTDPPFTRAAAFCGLGNPQSFRRTLEVLGVPLADWLEFPDHHRYRPYELHRIRAQALANGARALLTTAKDTVNLCEASGDLLAPLPLYWLDAKLVIEEESRFLGEIRKRLAAKEK